MTEARLCSALAAILALGLLGSGAELLLLEHYEKAFEFVPLVGIALALATLAWHRLAPGRRSRRSLQSVLVALVVAGALGVVLHMRGSAEFQREMDPSLGGFALWWKTLRAKAPPALAPGVLTQLGLLGLVYTTRAASADARS